MTKRTVLVAGLALAALAACSKTPPPAETAPPPPPGASAAATADKPQPPAQKAEKLKALIALRPECQQFIVELDDTGKGMMASGEKLNEIVARAGAAGCTQAPSGP